MRNIDVNVNTLNNINTFNKTNTTNETDTTSETNTTNTVDKRTDVNILKFSFDMFEDTKENAINISKNEDKYKQYIDILNNTSYNTVDKILETDPQELLDNYTDFDKCLQFFIDKIEDDYDKDRRYFFADMYFLQKNSFVYIWDYDLTENVITEIYKDTFPEYTELFDAMKMMFTLSGENVDTFSFFSRTTVHERLEKIINSQLRKKYSKYID